MWSALSQQLIIGMSALVQLAPARMRLQSAAEHFAS